MRSAQYYAIINRAVLERLGAPHSARTLMYSLDFGEVERLQHEGQWDALGDLMDVGRVSKVGYVAGVEAADRSAPRHNLTGDSYFTDGLRAVAIFAETRTKPTFLDWA